MKIIKNLHSFLIYIDEYSLIPIQSLYDRDYLYSKFHFWRSWDVSLPTGVEIHTETKTSIVLSFRISVNPEKVHIKT